MFIIKKSGQLEIFDPHKILTSIENSAKDIGIALNSSDLNLIQHDIYIKISNLRKHHEHISSYELTSIVIEVLTDLGFNRILKSYLQI
ncbi:hypothetical protein JCM1393_26820 [Clostridium carnis]